MDNETFNPDEEQWQAFGPVAEVPRKRTKRYLILGTSLAVIGVAVAFAVSPSATPSAAAATALRQALSSTLAHDTVNISLNETVNVGSQSFSFSGGGQCDLQTAQCSETVTSSDLPGVPPLSESMIFSNGVMYIKVVGGGITPPPTPWMSMSVKDASNQQSGLGTNPMAGLALMAKEGAAVTDEGMTSVNGENMHAYKVFLSSADLKNTLRKSAAGLPKSLLKSLGSVPLGPITLTVDIDQAGQIAQMLISTSVSENGQTVTVAGTETLTAYGAAINIVIPPASQVTPITNLNSQLGLS